MQKPNTYATYVAAVDDGKAARLATADLHRIAIPSDASLTNAEKVAAIKGICEQSRAAKAAGAALTMLRFPTEDEATGHAKTNPLNHEVFDTAIASLSKLVDDAGREHPYIRSIREGRGGFNADKSFLNLELPKRSSGKQKE
jgi:hypothetical protein